MSNIDFTLIKELLQYDQNTGIFTWKKTRGGNAKIGDVAGCLDKDGYVRININSRKYGAHRLAWFYVHGQWPKNFIDHINRTKNDNRICNLRDVTRSVNMQNLNGPQGANKFLGVHKRKNKWRAKIEVNSKQINLGTFDTEEKAYQAYLDAKKIYHPTAPHLTAF